MKKKKVIVWIFVIIVIVLSVYILYSRLSIGNINGRYTEPTTLQSTISFSGKEGDRIRFLFQSQVESGDLDIILYDSNHNAVYDLGKAKEMRSFFTISNSDTYILAAECKNFIGDFKVKVIRYI